MSLTAHHGDGLAIYPTLPADAFTLIVSDGAYGIGGFPGDPKTAKALAEWYAPHLEAWDRLAAPSSSLYFWGSPESCARMLPAVERAGWAWRSRIVWAKAYGHSSGFRGWPMWSEEAHHYVRDKGAGLSPMSAAGASDDNTVREFLRSEWLGRAGLRISDATDRAYKSTASHFFTRSQWEMPTWDAFALLAAYAKEHAPAVDRPYLVTEAVWQAYQGFAVPPTNTEGAVALRESYEALREEYEALREEYEALREEYEATRYPFELPDEFAADVWPDASAPNTAQRHPCAKRDEHIERIVLASSRPGDRVLEPFGGGAPVLRACRKLGRACDSIERDERWHRAALASLGDVAALPDPKALKGQGSLWGGA